MSLSAPDGRPGVVAAGSSTARPALPVLRPHRYLGQAGAALVDHRPARVADVLRAGAA
ncbi:hypothetical protein [Nocardia testacea]|uniref:Uncharacterized protein n=1 Tax=Nocardia testacea TaxID=248551 RepID=A0ABW7VX23_9NOCA